MLVMQTLSAILPTVALSSRHRLTDSRAVFLVPEYLMFFSLFVHALVTHREKKLRKATLGKIYAGRGTMVQPTLSKKRYSW